jgi:hypothetical protein
LHFEIRDPVQAERLAKCRFDWIVDIILPGYDIYLIDRLARVEGDLQRVSRPIAEGVVHPDTSGSLAITI